MTNVIYPSPLAEKISYEQIKYGLKTHNPYGVPEVGHYRCCDEAIKCIGKLEKIAQILDDWKNSGEEDDPINIIDSIEEVVEDGNDDC